MLVLGPVGVIGTSRGDPNNFYILKAQEPLFKSQHDGHLRLVAVVRYWSPKVPDVSLFICQIGQLTDLRALYFVN